MIKLTEIFETRYFTEDYIADLSYLIRKYLECRQKEQVDFTCYNQKIPAGIRQMLAQEEGIIDLAEARLVKGVVNEVAKQMQLARGLVRFVDTKDKVRHEFYQECHRRILLQVKRVPLPRLTDMTGFYDSYIKNLSAEVTYEYSSYDKSVFDLVTLISFLRPEIQLITTSFNQYFKYTWSRMDIVRLGKAHRFDSFLYLPTDESGSYLEVAFETDHGLIPGLGPVRYDEFIERFICIPAEVGRAKGLLTAEYWRPFLKLTYDGLSARINQSSVSLYEFLQALTGMKTE